MGDPPDVSLYNPVICPSNPVFAYVDVHIIDDDVSRTTTTPAGDTRTDSPASEIQASLESASPKQ